jgi:hypothetical protein
MPLLLALGVIAPSCAVLTPGRVNASAGTPARGSCETFTPDPVEGRADPPPVHAVVEEDSVGTYTIAGGAAVVGGAGTGAGCGNGRSWSGVSTPDGRVAGGRLLGCCELS